MPNKRHNDMTVDGGVPTSVGSSKKGDVKESKGVSWPGLPGKSGPDRSAGVKKVKTSHVSKGV